ncbi:Bifunctional solanapyrone synthase [Cytospora mali]|uniref:Bifunctional solanapyrone synthase n=1 Tax=Cytospora mali TaxID=578113 RepID=A0A194V3D6_CYTMA|nr:Bifunctional solanapyrone synthase [Valsa mali var. pyri (nom. inval.)]
MASPPQTECLIAAGLGSQVFLPDNPKYVTSNGSYFDNGAKLHPACFFQPRTTAELATAVKALSDVDQPFAVRSGGCTISAGSNNIDGGVTIELGLLKSVEYDSKTDTANVGSGATWQEVYDKLEKHQRVVSGGRAGSVGVGGYLLGGGLSFYTGLHGFACDNVVAYEVVLANGSIIIASADEHDDLFRVLKGGSNNFGIVTRFTLRTLPNGPVWGGVSVKPIHGLPRASQALVDFTANASNDPASTMIFVAGHQPKLGGEVIMTLTFNAAGVEKPKAFDQFMSLPETFSQYTKGNIQGLLPFQELPRDFYNLWYTNTFKNDAAIVIKASELLFQLGKDLENRVSDGDFNTHVAFLPIPRLYAEKAEAAGGNVLGLDHLPYDAIMLQASASVRTAELADWVRPRIQTLLDDVRAFAVSREGFVDWKYLNYAHDSQEVLQGYGQDNVQKIREAAAKYDPKGVFQRLCSGGFKVSAVKD